MDALPLLTRDKLGGVFKTPEVVRAFEALFIAMRFIPERVADAAESALAAQDAATAASNAAASVLALVDAILQDGEIASMREELADLRREIDGLKQGYTS